MESISINFDLVQMLRTEELLCRLKHYQQHDGSLSYETLPTTGEAVAIGQLRTMVKLLHHWASTVDVNIQQIESLLAHMTIAHLAITQRRITVNDVWNVISVELEKLKLWHLQPTRKHIQTYMRSLSEVGQLDQWAGNNTFGLSTAPLFKI